MPLAAPSRCKKGMLARNAAVPPEKHLIFRVGVNIGDIIIDGQDIFGDGVNVAARLESLCEPGGICISRAANEQIRDKLHLSFADMGEHTVKNIARAIGVFGLSAQDIATLPEAENENKIEERGRRHILASMIPSVWVAVYCSLSPRDWRCSLRVRFGCFFSCGAPVFSKAIRPTN
jgi:hypothetical protein